MLRRQHDAVRLAKQWLIKPILLKKFNIDSAFITLAMFLLGTALLNVDVFSFVNSFARKDLSNTASFILVVALTVAYVKASGAENMLGRAFEGADWQMVMLTAILGGLSPFCSCEVIPCMAALLALVAPLTAVMAFWLASPPMDPAMFQSQVVS